MAEKNITTDEKVPVETLEGDITATEKADEAEIKKKTPKKTIQQLREENCSYTHEFAQPFTYKGNTVKQLTFNWSSLTGRDSTSVERELSMTSSGRGAQNFGREHMALLAARACSARDEKGSRIVDKDFMGALPIIDFEEITSMGRLFFRLWGLL